MKAFLITLFWKQNKYHKYSVLIHTLSVCKALYKYNRKDLLVAGLLHDIGKPFVAYQDEEDILENNSWYSFTDHEEKSYQIIKNWANISFKTKTIVRYHYLITGMAVDDYKFSKTYDDKYTTSYTKRLKIWNSLSKEIQDDLMIFKICDDLGKGFDNTSAVPNFLRNKHKECIKDNIENL